MRDTDYELRHHLNHYWKTVVDTIQDGVMIVNTDGTIVSANRGFEEITGYSHEELIGQPCALLSCSTCEFALEAEGSFCILFQQGTLRQQRCELRQKNGDMVHVVKNASVLKDQNGKVIGAVETVTDVTDLIDKERQIETYRRELDQKDRFHGMIGTSARMQQVFYLIANAAKSDAPVIVHGESGTGKELVAKAIHESSHRKEKPFIKVNCAALNESLLESELFGHVKGAYTGAHRDREGRFEAAEGGNIFLDEIGDLPLATQVKLLRVLEEKVIERVGDHQPVHVDVRIISATNRDLPKLIDTGAFREDFFYRINVIPIWVPPLRERAEDIPLLAMSFFRLIRLQSGKDIEGVSREAMDALVKYPWPGNVRELRSAFEFAFVSCQDRMIGIEHLPHPIARNTTEPPPSESAPAGIEELKKERLLKALEASGGNQSKAARILGISRTSVWSQMKRFHIKAPHAGSKMSFP
ncbi:MAG: sigma 54-interacting transcriptional regulator [Desulfobacteraceae bacterium]|jgi:PAS domain S-box-containing protein